MLPHQPECRTRAAAGQGSVEGGARADRVESGGRWGSEGRKMGRGAEGAGLVAVSKEKAHYCSAAAGNSANLAPFFGVF